MRISDEQRREIAGKLRSLDERIEGMPLMCTKQEHNAMALRAIRAVVGKGDIFHLLADLIDRPTCNMDVMTTDERADYECSEHIMRCLNCGAEFGYVLYSEDGDVSMDDKPNYCPHCGTRVVSDDD